MAVYGCLFVGMLGKETAAVGFLLIPLICASAGRSWSAPLVGGVAFLTALVSERGLLTLVNLGEAGGMRTDWWSWLLVQSTAVVRLLGLSAWPWFGGFTPDYDYDIVAWGWRVAALGVVLLLPVVVWRLRRVQPLLAMGLLWCLIAVGPRLVVQTPRSYLNEHQFYLPFIGLVMGGVGVKRG